MLVENSNKDQAKNPGKAQLWLLFAKMPNSSVTLQSVSLDAEHFHALQSVPFTWFIIVPRLSPLPAAEPASTLFL